MTKYLVTMNSIGYGEFGNPRRELMCEKVDSSGLYLLFDDIAALADIEMVENPVKRLKIEVNRI